MGITPDVDLYAALNISVDATADEIKHAYRQLVRQVHPDMQNTQGTALLFRQVQESYEILSDPIKRAAYDRQRTEAGLSPNSFFQWKMQPSRAALSVGVDEQVVLPGHCLRDLADGAACDLDALARTPGIGRFRVDRDGDALLATLRAGGEPE